MRASRSLVVLTQAETMNEAAANALLKTLEEPGRATLILIAPSPSALLNTIVSRCQKIPFYPLNRSDLERSPCDRSPPEFWQEVSPALFDLGAGSREQFCKRGKHGERFLSRSATSANN